MTKGVFYMVTLSQLGIEKCVWPWTIPLDTVKRDFQGGVLVEYS